MMDETSPASNSTATPEEESLFDHAKDTLTGAGGAIRGAVDGVVDAAKENPVAAAAIAAGAAAAVAGAAFGVSKLRDRNEAN